MEPSVKIWIGINWLSTYQQIDDDIQMLISIHRTGGSQRQPEFRFNIDLIVAQTLGDFSYPLLHGTHLSDAGPYGWTGDERVLLDINHLLSPRQVDLPYKGIRLLYHSALTKAIKFLWPQVRSS